MDDNTAPCFTPLTILNEFEISPFYLTLAIIKLETDVRKRIIIEGRPSFRTRKLHNETTDCNRTIVASDRGITKLIYHDRQ